MTTSWPCRTASMPYFTLRQTIMAAPGARPPSWISSQPIRRRPFAPRNVSIRRMNQLWRLVLVFEALGLHPSLGLRARLPLVLRALVAADVDELAGEEGQHLLQHVLEEREGLVLHVVDVAAHAPPGAHGEPLAGVAELGVGGDGGLRVAGHLDLGHDRDEALLGVARRPRGSRPACRSRRRACRRPRCGSRPSATPRGTPRSP